MQRMYSIRTKKFFIDKMDEEKEKEINILFETRYELMIEKRKIKKDKKNPPKKTVSFEV